MPLDRRHIAVSLAGFCAFLDLYAPQSILPMLAQEFGATAGDVGLTVSATTFAIALIAPFTGAVADMLGRKRVIVAAMFALVVPTFWVALAGSLGGIVAWRFAQGLLLPPVFAVVIAYIGEEYPAAEATAVTGIYLSASSFGGFMGRFLTGVLAEHFGWRIAFGSLAVLTLGCAIGVAALLPRERRFQRTRSLIASLRQMRNHLRAPRLVATYAVGFGVLFTFVATFTYVNFHLAAPPFNLSPTALGAIFVVYLAGAVITPMTGRAVARFGRRRLVLVTLALWAVGLLVTLAPSLPAILAGLTLSAACGFLCQAVSTGFVAVSAREGRSSAVGLYVTGYYIGGSVGGVVPGFAWASWGWPGCIAIVLAILAGMALIVATTWRETSAPAA
jgi:predicted MFS family arabinose efflux permease